MAATARAQAKGTTAAPKVVTYQRPYLYPKQLEAIFEPKDCANDNARFSWIEASTKAGKTVGCIAWIYEQAYLLGGPNKNFWWVAPSYGIAEIAFRRLKNYLPRDQFTSNESKLTITLVSNGAKIWFKGADKPDSLYGEDVYAAVIDEGSRCKEEAWHALRSTLTATRGALRVIGNVKGRKNWFYKNARRAEKGRAGHAFYRITADDAVQAGVLDKDEIAGAEEDLPAAVFQELYKAIASDDDGNPFGIAYLDKIRMGLAPGPARYWGIDLAKKRDWTVIIGLNAKGQVCYFERFRKGWEETTDHIIRVVGMSPALIDATGVGDPIVERVQKKCTRAEGYVFTPKSKQRLMEGLAVAIQRGETTVLTDEANPVHYLELEAFEYVYTRTGVQYSAPEGMTDDCVMAHGLAIQCKASGPDLSVWEKLNG